MRKSGFGFRICDAEMSIRSVSDHSALPGADDSFDSEMTEYSGKFLMG
jgi:hypothetical protein